MEAVVLCGVQGAGKTSFDVDRFLGTHVRISRDLLRTAHREQRFLDHCLETGQPFVEHRRPYVEQAGAAGFALTASWVDADPQVAIGPNARRGGAAQVPGAAILGTREALVAPTREEGFDAVLRVRAEHGALALEPVAGRG